MVFGFDFWHMDFWSFQITSYHRVYRNLVFKMKVLSSVHLKLKLKVSAAMTIALVHNFKMQGSNLT